MITRAVAVVLALSMIGIPVSARCSNTRSLANGYVEVTDCWGKSPCRTWVATRAFADEWAQNAADDDHCVRQG